MKTETPFSHALTAAGAALLVTTLVVAVLAHLDVSPAPYLFAIYVSAAFTWEHRRVTREAYWHGEYDRLVAECDKVINTAISWQTRALRAEKALDDGCRGEAK